MSDLGVSPMRCIGLLLVLLMVTTACGGGNDDDSDVVSEPSATTIESTATATSEPTGTPETTNTATPTATPATTPSPAATPEPEGLYVRDFGFGQKQDQGSLFNYVSWGIIIENTDSVHAIVGSEYEIAFLDEDDFAVETTSRILTLILPGQRLGVAGRVSVSEGTRISSMQVRLQAGSAEISSWQPFVVERVTLYEGQRYPHVSGIINNPSDKIVTGLEVSIIAYDEAGQINGGGLSFVDVVPASGRAVGGTAVITDSSVASVEMFATVRMLAREIAVDPETELQVSKFGFGIEPDQSALGWAAVITNPNPDTAVTFGLFQVSFYDEEGRPLDGHGGWIYYTPPGDTRAIGSISSYSVTGTVPTTMEIALAPGPFADTGEFEWFTDRFIVEALAYQEQPSVDRPFSPHEVTAIIRNPYDDDIVRLEAVAVLFDAAGNIIGGGRTGISFIPAQGETSIAVGVAASAAPATVELYIYPSTTD